MAATLLKRHFEKNVFLWVLQVSISGHFFYRTLVNGCFSIGTDFN